jgi:hypothetical protein
LGDIWEEQSWKEQMESGDNRLVGERPINYEKNLLVRRIFQPALEGRTNEEYSKVLV